MAKIQVLVSFFTKKLFANKMPHTAIGAVLGLFTAIATAVFLLCFRAAAVQADRFAIVFAVMLSAAIFNSVVACLHWKERKLPKVNWWKSALFLSGMTLIGNVGLSVALPKLGAGITSTMMQLQIFVVALGAWFFLKEKVSGSLMIGAVVAALGFSLFAIPGMEQGSVSAEGLLASIVTVICFASMLVWTRAVIQDLAPAPLNAGRLWLAALCLLIWPGVWPGTKAMSFDVWILCIGAAAAGPFLARLAIMYALRFIGAAQTKLWTMLSPVFAFAMVYFVYGNFPSTLECLGALLIIGGVVLPTVMRLKASS